MRTLSPKTLLHIREFLLNDYSPSGSRMACVEAIDRCLTPRRSTKLARKRRAEKDAEKRSEWAEIRSSVLGRAEGRCEVSGCPNGNYGAVDHMFGGSGRRQTLQSVYTCWALCVPHDKQKTGNRPSAELWLETFVEHAQASAMDYPNGSAHFNGYRAAASIAQARLDSLRLQGRVPA